MGLRVPCVGTEGTHHDGVPRSALSSPGNPPLVTLPSPGLTPSSRLCLLEGPAFGTTWPVVFPEWLRSRSDAHPRLVLAPSLSQLS